MLDDSRVVFVLNIPIDLPSKNLKEIFIEFGNVLLAYVIPVPIEYDASITCGLIVYESE